MLQPNDEFLFTRQRHEADVMGLHYDLRLVHKDKAYSFATLKDMPKPGEIIGVFEQPVHDRAYALSKKVVIPKGQYGAGTTYLDWVRKAVVAPHSTETMLVIFTKDGEKFLLKKSPTKENEKSWILRNITGMGKSTSPYLTRKSSIEKRAWALDDYAGGNVYLEKIAKKKEQKDDLRPHQTDALDHLDKEHGVVLHHSLGSGKTKTFLKAVQRYQEKYPKKRALVIAPASLVTNVDKELKKHNIKLDRDRLDVMSYEKAVIDAHKLRKNDYSIAVADEAHRLRNTNTKRTRELRDIISGADRRLLATATGNYNKLSDISALVNIAANDNVLPEESKKMDDRYTKEEIIKPGFKDRLLGAKPEAVRRLDRRKELKEILNQYVSFYDSKDDPEAAKHFPKKTEKIVEVEMSKDQQKYYKFAEGKIPFLLRMKIRHNLPLDKKEKANLNAFSTGVRQVSNGYRHLTSDGKAEYSPKILKAVESLQKGMSEDKNFKALVYSNYLDAGLKDYSRKLQEMKIDHAVYDGSLSRAEKDQLVKDYNSGRKKILLISSSGSEGLDSKGTKRVQVLEPHFNPSKINQVVGRAVRFGSHAHLPEEERKVLVEHFHSVHPKPLWGKTPYSIDKYLSENSDTKEELFDEVKSLMKND
jgi:SNF2 family DNA or RNA helicase